MSSEVLSPARIASLVGAAVLEKRDDEVEVQRSSMALFQVNGYTPDKLRAFIYVVIDWDMTLVRVSFSGNQGLSFEFKIFANEATEQRVRRYTNHYMGKHKHHLSMMQNLSEKA